LASKFGIVVPWRITEGRAANFKAVDVRRKLMFPDIPIYKSDSAGEKFNPSEARNRGCIQAFTDGCDIVAVLDADTLFEKSSIEDAVNYITTNGGICYAYTRSTALDMEETERVIEDIEHDPFAVSKIVDTPWEDQHVGSGWVLDKPGFYAMNGWDENFVCWGYEDNAFENTYKKMYGIEMYRALGDCLRLFHMDRDMQNIENNSIRFELYKNSSKGRVKKLILDNMLHIKEQEDV
jgi:hypothetical protein